MEKVSNIYQRVNAVMKEVTYIQKENKKVNGQYTFVSHDAVTGILHEPMARHGIVMVPTVAELEQEGNRTSIKMEINFINIDKPEDKITVYHWGYGIDSQDKGIGKAVSYAVKYALLKLFCLETGDDVEKDNIDYVPSQAIIEAEANKKLLDERKRTLLKKVGNDNKEMFLGYVNELKKIYKSKTEEQLFLDESVETFIGAFHTWKEKQAKAA